MSASAAHACRRSLFLDLPVTGFVDLRNVRLSYGEGSEATLALDDLSMSIRKGEFAAVVGPSGCGKSTLMKLATGLIKPQTGTVEVANHEVDGPVSIAGMAFQNPSMLPWRSTLSNVMLPLEIVQPHRARLRREKTAYTAKAEDLLKLVGLQGFGEKFPWQLSGGMQQRANLCRALVHDPALLMLDEPFGALDAFTREELWQVMRDLHAEKSFTVILVTHDLREAVFLADASRSIDDAEIMFQRRGYADAITHPDVLGAIEQGFRRRIAVTYVEWGDQTSQDVVVPWMIIDGKDTAAAFAAALLDAPRLAFGPNAIGNALAAAQALIESNDIEAFRRVIDFSGDSANNFGGVPIAAARSSALTADITINGLAILCKQEDCGGRPNLYDLEEAFAKTIIGGPGSFVVTADDRLSYAEAVRRKLVLEIAELMPPRRH